MKELNEIIKRVTSNIRDRSLYTREEYLQSVKHMNASKDNDKNKIGCSNLAHAAASSKTDKLSVLMGKIPNIGIVSAYNDMLSAHKPFEKFPDEIRSLARSFGATAQVAGCVPAMCDGITQGRPGMELSLMSRDVIAMATAVSLSHNVYDCVISLGICDKIVPGMVIGALSHGHLPMIFIPAGPMSSGIPNSLKTNVRKEYAQGTVGRNNLLEVESQSYHGIGTCTFYGTANSNQMLMEIMGLQLPNSSFEHPTSDARKVFNREAVRRILSVNRKTKRSLPIGEVLDERSFVNAIVGLHATGGSTNHLLHIPAMAAAAGIKILWEDFEQLSKLIPLIARIYPNGNADVNDFHKAGGMAFIFQELINEGMLDTSAKTSWGHNISEAYNAPFLKGSEMVVMSDTVESSDLNILRPVSNPFRKTGGIRVLKGNLGKSIIKVSAVESENLKVSAPAMVFNSQSDVKAAFAAGLLDQDVVVVVRGQGPRANGMPELHSLTPVLSVVQERGFQVALITDGRMSGASGKIPAAIHLYPEACENGPINKIKNGDLITLDAVNGTLMIDANSYGSNVDRSPVAIETVGFGRGLFSVLRQNSGTAEMGGGINSLSK